MTSPNILNNAKCSKVDISVNPDNVVEFNGTLIRYDFFCNFNILKKIFKFLYLNYLRNDDSLFRFLMKFDVDMDEPNNLYEFGSC